MAVDLKKGEDDVEDAVEAEAEEEETEMGLRELEE